MIVESLLPLGKLDPGLREPETPLDIRRFAELAQTAEDVGLDAILVEETKDDPFQLLALGASTTSSIQLGTSVAMAFPRSPTATALSAWSLAKLSNGRFVLGLGSQVRAHIERRYGLPWHAPAPWMRDYINAMRAVWDCWQNGTKLDFSSDHYNLNVMVPLFNPGPIEHPNIPIHIAAIGPNMVALAGEVAEVLPRPVRTAQPRGQPRSQSTEQAEPEPRRSRDGAAARSRRRRGVRVRVLLISHEVRRLAGGAPAHEPAGSTAPGVAR